MNCFTALGGMSPKLLEKHQWLLRSIPLFAGLTASEMSKIAGLAKVRTYPARTIVVAQGEPATALFAIVHGRLKVVSSGPDGKDTVLGIMAEGEVFGEVALLDGGKRSATCTTIEPCELLVVDRTAFVGLLESSPKLAIELLQVLARRLRRLSQRSEDTAFLEVPARLARTLLDLAARFGERQKEDAGIVIALRLSQQELGELVGATRESVNKHLNEWTRQGFVKVQEGRVWISDAEPLRTIARLEHD